jgi:UDP-N-acetylglucosamine 2-epimerase (non-hydrolysing)
MTPSKGAPLKIVSIFGTRPEAIKMAPVVKRLEEDSQIEQIICTTGQHREMLDQVLSAFDIRPTIDLAVMQPGQTLAEVTSRILLGTTDVIRQTKPDLILVHGDTTTCMAASLAGFYEGVKIGHVEAGLRTGNMRAPFPEEANRSIVGRIADLHFAPTQQAKRNLLNEAVSLNNIYVTGNTVIDALFWMTEKIDRFSEIYWADFFPAHVYQKLINKTGPMILITGHRRENFGQGFLQLCDAIRTLALAHPSWTFIYPVHLNPSVQEPVYGRLGDLANVHLISPMSYVPFVWLMNRSDLILTDSGGIQEEGPSLGKPVLVMRDVTERPEAVEAGTVKLVGMEAESIIANTELLLSDKNAYQKMAKAINPYGDGNATDRIVKAIKAHFGEEIQWRSNIEEFA